SWDSETGNCIRTFTGHSGGVFSCAFSHDNNFILSGSYDNTLKVWDAKTGNCIRTLSGHSGWVNSCAFSHDNNFILSGSYDNTLKVWDSETGNCIRTMANLPQNETAVWDGNAKQLLSASESAWRWIGLSSGLRRLPIELLNTKKS
ncbi:MAG: hypothetical protein HGB23_10375, partial [Chlorobiaceae bacterium]|nr:hypothetical protein [Chlorobiaceae bacterium]